LTAGTGKNSFSAEILNREGLKILESDSSITIGIKDFGVLFEVIGGGLEGWG
jgi:hypothetical protein